MPTIRKPGQKPAPTPPVPTVAPQQSTPVNVPPQSTPVLLSPPTSPPKSAGTLAVSIPSFLAQTEMPDMAGNTRSGYVGFASTKSTKNWPAMQAAGLVDGQPYLFREQQYIPMPELKFFLLRAETFLTLMFGELGDFRYVSRDLEKPGPTIGTNRTEPHYVGLLLVFTPGGLVPIKGDFRGTKSGGFESAIGAIKAAASPEWAKMSDAHRISCAFPQPWGRVCTTITTQRDVSKSNGMAYFKTVGRVAPATMGEMEALSAAFGDDAFNASLNEANENYLARIKFLDETAAKLAQPQPTPQPGNAFARSA